MKEKLDEVERLKLAADAANVAKGHFLANMSHEIRTPLAAVMGFSDMIAKGNLTGEEKSESVLAIRRNGNLLLRLIDDILDFSKIESGILEMERIDFDLSEVLRDVSSSLSLKAQQKGLELKFNIDPLIKGWFVGDPTRIKQILLNVTGNAIKFTTQGTVLVTATCQKRNESSSIVVTVKDEGVGLTTAQAARLFKPFAQADVSTTRQFGGSGLGLTIARRLANQMDGTVELLESESGKGSTFKIAFKLLSSQRKEKAKPANAKINHEKVDLSQFKILAVDDLPDNLALINLFLRSTQAQLTFAENGEQAVKRAQEDRFDLILMDVQMPGLDGHAATREIRKNGFKRPIIALTAHAMQSEHEKCRDAGCDFVLPKPVSREILLGTLKNYLL